MAYVRVNGDSKEALELALKKFGQKVNKEGILKEVKKRDSFVPPSMKRKLKKLEARKRFMKNLKKRRERETMSENSKYVSRNPTQSGGGR
jgi:small subunit ribosomal protein S21